jgi:[protein-PII] uridylyltransferase
MTEGVDAFVREFRDSLPGAYRNIHDEAASREHARVARERTALVNIGLLPADRGAEATLCVVAEDRPGLLAAISAALMLSSMEVMDAEVHTRRRSGAPPEAVDLFWVRRAPGDTSGFRQTDVEHLANMLTELITGRLGSETARERASLIPAGTVETTVRFIENADGELGTLEVETGDRSGLLLALTQALFDQDVQIEESQVRTQGARVQDRFRIVELDGSPISPERRLEIQVAVLGAVDPGKPAN